MVLTFPIDTEHLMLKRFTSNDLEEFSELINDRDYKEYIGPHTIKNLDYITREYQRTEGTGVLKAYERLSNKLIGLCGLTEDISNEGLGILYFVLPQFRRKGYATEMAQKLVDLTFNLLKKDIVLARVSPMNPNSISLLTKIGLSYYKPVPNLLEPQKDCLYKLERDA